MVSAATRRGEVTDQLHLYHDPFAATTQSPKIPDGLTELSVGLHQQAVSEITGALASGLIDIVIFPGLGIICDVDGTSSGGAIPFNRIINQVSYNTTTYVDSATTFTINMGDNNLARWRLVSAGVQLKCLNPVESDDGWWEAARLPFNKDSRNWSLVGTAPGLPWINQSLLVPESLASVVNPNMKSYATGLLRDLGKVQFDLNPVGSEHKFKLIQPNFGVVGPTNMTVGTTTVSDNASFQDRATNFDQFFDNSIDDSWDIIMIRVHGRDATSALGGTRLHANVVANYEFCYDDSEFQMFETTAHSIGDSAMSMHRDAKQNPSAATVIP